MNITKKYQFDRTSLNCCECKYESLLWSQDPCRKCCDPDSAFEADLLNIMNFKTTNRLVHTNENESYE
jgi:hypothetical protein